MYIYNVTTAVDPSIKEEWILWMKEFFLPEMLATKKFHNAYLMEVLTSEKNVCSFAVHYQAHSPKDILDYEKEYKNKMESMMWKKFAEKALSFPTKLKKV